MSLQERPYRLPQHVYVCKTAGAVVFLDLKRDRYFGLSGPQMHALASVVPGWPVEECGVADTPRSTEAQGCRVADLMVKRGLLTTDTHAGKSATPIRIESAQDSIGVAPVRAGQQRVRLTDFRRFVAAWAWTTWMMRSRSLERVVREMESRKLRPGDGTTDSREIGELVEAFRHLRRYAFTAKDRCLFHAIVLVNFLSRYGYFPTWVIGVRSVPWGAHSWVQAGPCVLDSTPEEVAAYTPILAV